MEKEIAERDYPVFGVKKGQECYVWKMGGKVYRSLEEPKRSRTVTGHWAEVYAIEEGLSPFRSVEPDGYQEFYEHLGDAIDALSDVQSRYEEAPNSEAKIDTLDGIIGLLESAQRELGILIEELDEGIEQSMVLIEDVWNLIDGVDWDRP
jgi:hypothetical protein